MEIIFTNIHWKTYFRRNKTTSQQLTCDKRFFSLDDYGSGYSNTDYLFRFPFHMVKIDKLILWEACKNEKAMIALKNTIQMIKELGLQVVVEGVETAENVHYLTQQHCDFLQGYYYSKPVPESALIEILHQMSA